MFPCMMIINQRDFLHISSQGDNKKLKPLEKLKILSIIIDHIKLSLHHSNYVSYKVWFCVQWVYYRERKYFSSVWSTGLA